MSKGESEGGHVGEGVRGQTAEDLGNCGKKVCWRPFRVLSNMI